MTSRYLLNTSLTKRLLFNNEPPTLVGHKINRIIRTTGGVFHQLRMYLGGGGGQLSSSFPLRITRKKRKMFHNGHRSVDNTNPDDTYGSHRNVGHRSADNTKSREMLVIEV